VARKTTRKTTRVKETVVEEPRGELEVEEVVAEKPPAPPASTETLMVVVTLAALVAAFVLIRMKSVATFGEGWPF
jgi:hypothetical protein